MKTPVGFWSLIRPLPAALRGRGLFSPNSNEVIPDIHAPPRILFRVGEKHLLIDHILDRLPFLLRRNLVWRGTRAFLESRGCVEVETPYAVPTPGEEVHLQPFHTVRETPDGMQQNLFLHTSPEFAMKRIVAATGLPVFQFARVWRNGEGSYLHAPEFTMLEWYQPNMTLEGLMDETEALLQAVLPPILQHSDHSLSISGPFERLTMQEAFHRHAGVDRSGQCGLYSTAPHVF